MSTPTSSVPEGGAIIFADSCSARLPPELIRLVAKSLHADRALKTLTLLSQTSRKMYELVTPYAYKTVGFEMLHLEKLFQMLAKVKEDRRSVMERRDVGQRDSKQHPLDMARESRLRWLGSLVRSIIYPTINPENSHVNDGIKHRSYLCDVKMNKVLSQLSSIAVDSSAHSASSSAMRPGTCYSYSEATFLQDMLDLMPPQFFFCHVLRDNITALNTIDIHRVCTSIQHDVNPDVGADIKMLIPAGNSSTLILDFGVEHSSVASKVEVVRLALYEYFHYMDAGRLPTILMTRPTGRDGSLYGDANDEKRLRMELDKMFESANEGLRRCRTQDETRWRGQAGNEASSELDTSVSRDQEGIKWGFLDDDDLYCPACGREYSRT